jgi:hypothetical protein
LRETFALPNVVSFWRIGRFDFDRDVVVLITTTFVNRNIQFDILAMKSFPSIEMPVVMSVDLVRVRFEKRL